jgi:hypothetical protein
VYEGVLDESRCGSQTDGAAVRGPAILRPMVKCRVVSDVRTYDFRLNPNGKSQ